MGRPNIAASDIDLVCEVLQSDVLSMGPYTERFEEMLADRVGRAYGIACSSGTAALHLAVRALGLGEGHEVITTPFSFVASSNCVLYERAIPRFVDIEEETYGLDPNQVERAVSPATRGLLPVDVFGHPARLTELVDIADRRGLWLVEDACEGLGSSLQGKPLGSFGSASTLAFYPNKQITTGEGGMVLTDDPNLAARMRSERNQGRDADGTWLRHVNLGFNYRIDEMSAALGVAQLQRVRAMREGRRAVAAAYERYLGNLPWLRLPTVRDGAAVDWFVYVVTLHPEVDRDRLIQDLGRQGIPTRPYFSSIHLQPYYADLFGYRAGDFPVTERVAARTLALPFSSRHTQEEVALVSETLVETVTAQLAA